MKTLVRAVFLCGFLSNAGPSQPASTRPEFEVVSIRPADSANADMKVSYDPGTLTIRNASLKSLIELAYRVKDHQILGGPGWLNSARYDLVAKISKGAPAGSHREMLKTALSERFQLRLRPEARMLPVYALVVARNGPKLAGPASEGGRASVGQRQIAGKAMQMKELADALSNVLSRPVIDKTALAGRFEIGLQWSPDERESREPKPGAVASIEEEAHPSTLSPSDASVFAALQEQLGLRLEASKGPVNALVIERAEKPSEN